MPRRYIQKGLEVVGPSQASFGKRQWILSRGNCLYRLFALGDTPGAERKNALQLRILEWSPYAHPGSYVVWHDDKAQVWLWDEAARLEVAQGIKGAAALAPIPETLLQPRPEADGLRLLPCVAGVDAQLWGDGILLASRWWAASPSGFAWTQFLLANDLGPETKMLEPCPKITWRNIPWALPAAKANALGLRHESLWISLVFAVLAFCLVWQLVGIWKWQKSSEVVAGRLVKLNQEVLPLREARKQAVSDKQAAERLADLAAYPAQLQLLAAVTEIITENKADLVEWNYDIGRLSFTLQGNGLDPRIFVAACQNRAIFQDVTAERGSKSEQLIMSMTVLKPAPATGGLPR